MQHKNSSKQQILSHKPQEKAYGKFRIIGK